jgi:hypothetical protein
MPNYFNDFLLIATCTYFIYIPKWTKIVILQRTVLLELFQSIFRSKRESQKLQSYNSELVLLYVGDITIEWNDRKDFMWWCLPLREFTRRPYPIQDSFSCTKKKKKKTHPLFKCIYFGKTLFTFMDMLVTYRQTLSSQSIVWYTLVIKEVIYPTCIYVAVWMKVKESMIH